MITKRPARTILVALCAASLLTSAPAKKEDLRTHYALIFGTAYGPDDRPLYGVKINIHPVGAKHPNWDLVSDHRGEFAQRVPPGPSDYLIVAHVDIAPIENGRPKPHRKKKLRAETRVHINGEERQDLGLHLQE